MSSPAWFDKPHLRMTIHIKSIRIWPPLYNFKSAKLLISAYLRRFSVENSSREAKKTIYANCTSETRHKWGQDKSDKRQTRCQIRCGTQFPSTPTFSEGSSSQDDHTVAMIGNVLFIYNNSHTMIPHIQLKIVSIRIVICEI